MLTILSAWLLADFISGLVHWWEDRALIGASRFAFINGVRADNERHHIQPGYLLKFSYWGNIDTTAPIGWAMTFVLFVAGAPFVLILTTFFLSFGNLIHRFAHEPVKRLPLPIRFMQWTGLFISMNHHNGHHFKDGKLVTREGSRIRYCVMTNWLNPVLDYINFFKGLEKCLGLKR